MENMELICFKMIANSGEARTNYMQALTEAKEGKFDKVDDLLTKGDEAFQMGHEAHAQLIQQEANNQKTEFSLLLMHAEDQMMNTETFRFVVTELIETYRRKEGIQ